MRHGFHLRFTTLLALVVGATSSVSAGRVVAQEGPPRGDVELLGAIHGTRPPPAYYELKAARPDAFTFDRAWFGRNPSLRRIDRGSVERPPRFEVVGDGDAGAGLELGVLAPREEAVEGTVRVPLLLGLFSDSPDPPFTRDRIQGEFFDGPNSRFGTITEYYDEVSGGRVELAGETFDWERSELTGEEVTGGSSGLGGTARVGGFILDLLSRTEGVDWGRYDNDGPDGIPNSGDDDGFVDILAVMHPDFGAECSRGTNRDDRIWSHKWTLFDATGQHFVTGTPAAGGGRIRVSDYTIQPVFGCPDGGGGALEINQIGVLAHELGHAFGLPDLYDTAGRHEGIGGWGLMGSGAWGCSQGVPERPCHMSAWSKAQLGWVDVVTLEPGRDVGTMVFEPVETAGRAYRVDAQDGSGEYFLLENRQPVGFDLNVLARGLAVWHVDPAVVSDRWESNTVNTDGDHMGVHLVQADGANDLGAPSGGNRGDAGDLFPGSGDVSAFHAGSDPGAYTYGGAASGLTLYDVRTDGADVLARTLTRMQTVTVRAEGEGAAEVGFRVDGAAPAPIGTGFLSAPFQHHRIAAGAGAPIEDGVRVGFEGWRDDPSLPRERTFRTPVEDVTLTAEYGGREVRARLRTEGGEFDVPPGRVGTDPGGAPEGDDGDDVWFDEGVLVGFEAVANTGYGFAGWAGELAGRANPAVVALDAPVDVVATFDLTFSAGEFTQQVVATRRGELVLTVENANDPVTWTIVAGDLPDGMSFDPVGRIEGVALETGTFRLSLRAVDGVGLRAQADVTVEVVRPALTFETLAASFLLRTSTLTDDERRFLDNEGNRNGAYDLGDLRAYLLAGPDAEESARSGTGASSKPPRTELPPLGPGSGGGGR